MASHGKGKTGVGSDKQRGGKLPAVTPSPQGKRGGQGFQYPGQEYGSNEKPGLSVNEITQKAAVEQALGMEGCQVFDGLVSLAEKRRKKQNEQTEESTRSKRPSVGVRYGLQKRGYRMKNPHKPKGEQAGEQAEKKVKW
jgi:hypothetical protein